MNNYIAVDIAKHIIKQYYTSCRTQLNITKLHKLLYVVYGAYLSIEETSLFNEEPLCLPYGPVFETVHQEYECGRLNLLPKNDYTSIDDYKIKEITKDVICKFGQYSAATLSKWSHRSGGAWRRTYNESRIWGVRINDFYIQEEFNELISWDSV